MGLAKHLSTLFIFLFTEIALERIKRLDQSGNDAWMWKEGNNKYRAKVNKR